jgi:hypothetical protein
LWGLCVATQPSPPFTLVPPLQSRIGLEQAPAVEGPDLIAFAGEGEDEALEGHVAALLLRR